MQSVLILLFVLGPPKVADNSHVPTQPAVTEVEAEPSPEEVAKTLVVGLIMDCESAARDEIRSSNQEEGEALLEIQNWTDSTCEAANSAFRPYAYGNHMFTYRDNRFSNAELANRLDAITSRIEGIRAAANPTEE